MTNFHKTTWDKVKTGDTVLIARVGKVVEVVIEDCHVDGPHMLVTYRIKGRSYLGMEFKLDEPVYVQS